jgi:hypothetical protein
VTVPKVVAPFVHIVARFVPSASADFASFASFSPSFPLGTAATNQRAAFAASFPLGAATNQL